MKKLCNLTKNKLFDVAIAPTFFAIIGIPALIVLGVAAVALVAVFLILKAVKKGKTNPAVQDKPEDPKE